MKVILTMFFVIWSVLGHAQNSTSCFVSTAGNQTDWYCFNGSSFRHINKTHQSYCYGEGYFAERNDSLILNYINLKRDYSIQEPATGKADSIRIVFQVVERMSNEPIDKASAFVERINEGTTSNSNGFGELALKKETLEEGDELKIQALGFPYKRIPIHRLIQYDTVVLNVWLSKRISFFKEEDEGSYKVLRKTKNKLQLQNEFGYNYKFKKTPLRKFEKLFNISGLGNAN